MSRARVARSPAVDGVDHRGVPVAGDVTDDGHDAAAAVGQPAEVEHVVAGVERQPGLVP